MNPVVPKPTRRNQINVMMAEDHGIRLMQPTLGEHVVVFGLGLLGLISGQLLRAHGCKVLGIDINPGRCELAKQFGCQAVAIGEGGDAVKAAEAFTAGRGADGVLITASAKTNDIVHQSAQMCRKKGRIVLVGVVGLCGGGRCRGRRGGLGQLRLLLGVLPGPALLLAVLDPTGDSGEHG